MARRSIEDFERIQQEAEEEEAETTSGVEGEAEAEGGAGAGDDSGEDSDDGGLSDRPTVEEFNELQDDQQTTTESEDGGGSDSTGGGTTEDTTEPTGGSTGGDSGGSSTEDTTEPTDSEPTDTTDDTDEQSQIEDSQTAEEQILDDSDEPTREPPEEQEITRGKTIFFNKEFDPSQVAGQLEDVDEGDVRAGPGGEFDPGRTAIAVAERTLDPDVPIDLRESDFTLQDGRPTLRPEIQRLIAAEQFDQQTDVDVFPSDFAIESGKPTLREESAADIIDVQTASEVDPADIRQGEQGFELTEPALREEFATQFEQQLQQEGAEIDLSPQDIILDDGQLNQQATQKRVALKQLDESTRTDLTTEDLTQQDGRFVLGDEPLREEIASDIEAKQKAQQDAFLEAVQEAGLQPRGDVSSPEPVPIEPADIELTTGGEFDQLETQRNLAVKRFGRKISRDVDTEDVVFSPATGATLTDEVQTDIATERTQESIEDRFGFEPGEDQIKVSGSGDVTLSPELRKSLAARNFNEQTNTDLSRGEDFELRIRGGEELEARQQLQQKFTAIPGRVDTGEIGVELTPTGRQAVTTAQIEDQGEIELGDDTVQITDPEEQLVFDDEGRIKKVRNPPDSLSEKAIDIAGDVTGKAVSTASVVTDPTLDALRGAREAAGSPSDRLPISTVDILSPTNELNVAVFNAVADSPVGEQINNQLSTLKTESEQAADFVNEKVVTPTIDSPAKKLIPPTPFALAGDDVQQKARKSVATTLVDLTVGGPAVLVESGRTAVDAAKFTEQQIDEEGLVAGTSTAATAAAGVTATSTAGLTRQAERKPVETFGQLAGSAAVGTALSPVRFTKFKVPKKSGSGTRIPRPTRGSVDVDLPKVKADISLRRMRASVDVEDTGSVSATRPGLERPDTTTLRGVNLRTPIAAEKLLPRKFSVETTVAGARGLRPVRGTPLIRDLEDVDVKRLGEGKAQDGPVFEPIRPTRRA